MSLENLVGWDFVKLETELKARALPLLLNGPEPQFLFQVLAFEVFLARSTLAIHNQQEPPQPEFALPGLNRLATILLTIRKQARRHLGVQRLRDRQWLEEYYFLLACYGVYAGLFDTYQTNRRQLATAYISAGVAARQLSIPTYGLDDSIRDQEQQAKTLVDSKDKDFDPNAHKLERATDEYCYHPRLSFARKWVRSKERSFKLGAIRILESLRMEYPHVLEIEDELALGYLEVEMAADFERLRTGVERRYNSLSEEFLSRLGRFWKRKGDEIRPAEPQPAREMYQQALNWYRQAYALRKHYYPGINVAGLEFVLGQLDAAKKTAKEVLTTLETWKATAEEMPWVYASKADALLILERHAEAEAMYRRAVALIDPRGKESMRRQVELLVQCAPPGSTLPDYWTQAKLEELFGPLS
jgi:tetratricopeptide (TPR) repeat protein